VLVGTVEVELALLTAEVLEAPDVTLLVRLLVALLVVLLVVALLVEDVVLLVVLAAVVPPPPYRPGGSRWKTKANVPAPMLFPTANPLVLEVRKTLSMVGMPRLGTDTVKGI